MVSVYATAAQIASRVRGGEWRAMVVGEGFGVAADAKGGGAWMFEHGAVLGDLLGAVVGRCSRE